MIIDPKLQAAIEAQRARIEKLRKKRHMDALLRVAKGTSPIINLKKTS
jgi:hypothetical protein